MIRCTTGCASTCTQGNGYDYGHWLAKDATAWPLIDIIGTHEYDSQKAEPWPADVDGGQRTKPIYETEVSGVMYWPEQGPSSDIKNGIAVAGWVHSAMVVGEASAWLYWWYQQSSDNEGLVLTANTMTKRCYTIGNYSKFVRPGAVMVSVAGNTNTEPAAFGLHGYRRHHRRGYQQGHQGSHRSDCDQRWYGAGLVHAQCDIGERQPQSGHRCHRDWRQLQRIVRQSNGHHVRLQVVRLRQGAAKAMRVIRSAWPFSCQVDGDPTLPRCGESCAPWGRRTTRSLRTRRLRRRLTRCLGYSHAPRGARSMTRETRLASTLTEASCSRVAAIG